VSLAERYKNAKAQCGISVHCII